MKLEGQSLITNEKTDAMATHGNESQQEPDSRAVELFTNLHKGKKTASLLEAETTIESDIDEALTLLNEEEQEQLQPSLLAVRYNDKDEESSRNEYIPIEEEQEEESLIPQPLLASSQTKTAASQDLAPRSSSLTSTLDNQNLINAEVTSDNAEHTQEGEQLTPRLAESVVEDAAAFAVLLDERSNAQPATSYNESYIPGDIILQKLNQSAAVEKPRTAEISALVQRLVDRIEASLPSLNNRSEIRLNLSEGRLAGTEIKIQLNGNTLDVQLFSSSTDGALLLSQQRPDLLERLQRLNNDFFVNITIDQQSDLDADTQDQQSRQQRDVYEEWQPEEDA